MSYIYYLLISFIFFIFQTVIFADVPFWAHFFDFFLIIIIYVGLFRPLSEGVVTVFFLGLFVDGISGSPFWVYTTTYIWLLIIIKWLIQYFNARSAILLPFVLVAGTLLENIFFIIVSSGFFSGSRMTLNGVHIIVAQVFGVILIGPITVVAIRKGHEKLLPEAVSGDSRARNKKT